MSRRAPANSRKPTKGIYANYFEVGHTAFEFVIDFGDSYANRRPRCHTRIVTSPPYARALLETLGEAVAQYRQEFERVGHRLRGQAPRRSVRR